ncbi:MAG: hypothetical protein U0470_02230 [Anaerolineae bacterium]
MSPLPVNVRTTGEDLPAVRLSAKKGNWSFTRCGRGATCVAALRRRPVERRLLLQVSAAPEGKLWQVWGHMHMLGGFTLDLIKPSGTTRQPARHPRWQFNWPFDLVTPIDLKAWAIVS